MIPIGYKVLAPMLVAEYSPVVRALSTVVSAGGPAYR